MRSKPLPPGLSGPIGIRELEPSDSPGGLTQTNASIPVKGLAVGRAPIPAPSWLHQLPLWILRSMRVAITNVRKSVEVLGPVGRFGPPQPLRDVSITKPTEAGYASVPVISALRKAMI